MGQYFCKFSHLFSCAFSMQTSFLSLNLHSLAEQLTKVDLSHRLFVEEDLLSPELMSVVCSFLFEIYNYQVDNLCKPVL